MVAFFTGTLIQLIYGLLAAVLAAVVYSIVLRFKDDPNLSQPIVWSTLYANVVFGIAVGFIAWLSGVVVTIDWLGGQIAAYGVIIALLDHIINGLINRTVSKPQFVFRDHSTGQLLKNPGIPTNRTQFYASLTAGVVATLRHMDTASRNYLVFDLPAWAKPLTLNCVDQAEAKNQYQYAIQSANWVFLIEDGELTGAKHFWSMFGWYGANVTWKPITGATLDAIRKTGRFPDYSVLV